MGMVKDCHNCTEKCLQAELAHQIALGRMYAINEFIALVKKIENGELVEVVRCKDCRYRIHDQVTNEWFCNSMHSGFVYAKPNDFCSYGERRTDD